jgi:hypothetical protein
MSSVYVLRFDILPNFFSKQTTTTTPRLYGGFLWFSRPLSSLSVFILPAVVIRSVLPVPVCSRRLQLGWPDRKIPLL